MSGANTGPPHRRKERIPPGPDALAAAEKLRTSTESTPSAQDVQTAIGSHATESTETGAVIYDLSVYERAAHGRNTL